jgi:hypothetical protein
MSATVLLFLVFFISFSMPIILSRCTKDSPSRVIYSESLRSEPFLRSLYFISISTLSKFVSLVACRTLHTQSKRVHMEAKASAMGLRMMPAKRGALKLFAAHAMTRLDRGSYAQKIDFRGGPSFLAGIVPCSTHWYNTGAPLFAEVSIFVVSTR